MKKPNLIIGKKQIILACLTLILGVAVYINYAMAQGDELMQQTEAGISLEDDKSAENSGAGKENYGDIKFVNGEEYSQNAEIADSSTGLDGTEYIAENNAESGASADENAIPDNISAEEYFAQARLEKMNSRDSAVQTLQSIIGGGDLSDDEMVTKQLEAVQLSQLVEKEGNIESLIKAQGFEDCVVYLDGSGAKIVVKSEGLTKGQVASIKDTILGEVSVPTENIRIFEVK